LNRIDRALASRSEADAEPEVSKSAGPIDFNLLLAAARRQARVLVVAALVGLLIGFAYIITALPQYTATTDILIDSQKDKNDLSVSIADLPLVPGRSIVRSKS
jgi:succinoglycan biosynthesis transport protein ExoP